MKQPFLLGLTGSIGMGKSTTAAMFADAGLAVWDADAAVHRLYAKGGRAVAPIRELNPEVIVDGSVDRTLLKDWIARDRDALTQIERIVHPLVGTERADFIAQAKTDIVVLDVPLLFETGGDKRVDAVCVVTAPADVQRERVLARGTMTPAQFDTILAKQMPDAEKRARADYVIETLSLDQARAQVHHVIQQIRAKLNHA